MSIAKVLTVKTPDMQYLSEAVAIATMLTMPA